MWSLYREERWMVWDKLITAGRRELSACLVKGVRYTFSAAVLRRAYLPPPTFSRGLGSWRCCQPSHRISSWQQLAQQKNKKRRNSRKQLYISLRFQMFYNPSVISDEDDEVFGFKRDSPLNEQVCPDIFLPPRWCYVTQNTICCVHSSICQKLNWRENCCDTVNSCLRSKQQTRHDGRFNTTCKLVHEPSLIL